MNISELDWKIFRKNIAIWQECYMEKLLKEYIALLQSDEDASTKFWKLEKHIKQDKKSPGILIELRRGNTINNIITLVLNGVISIDDLEEFSDELKETVKFMISIK